MISAAMTQRAEQLTARGTAFVTATVVRVQKPASVRPGSVALVLEDGTIDGFVGGVCTEHSVRAYSLQAMRTGAAVLLRVVPFDELANAGGEDAVADDGTVTVQNPCLSGGAIDLFLEPVLPAPRVLVVGATPIAAALLRIGPELGLSAVAADGAALDARPSDLAVVVAAHGRHELESLRAGLAAGVPYVGLVASIKRGTGVIAELRGDGIAADQLERIDVPAGLDIGARTPPEIALSILASIISARRAREQDPVPTPVLDAESDPRMAIDPICGMTVAVMPDTPSVEHDGQTVYFCCQGCKTRFAQQVA